MPTLKFIAACAAGLFVFALAWRKSRALTEKARIAEALAASASRIRSAIKHRRALKRELLAELPFPDADGDEAALLEAVDSPEFPFGEKDADRLRAFIRELGEGSLERQLALVEDFGEYWAAAAESAKREKTEKGRLFLSLGGLGGLALTIILA